MARRRVEDDLADELVVVAGGRRRRAGGGVVPLHLEREDVVPPRQARTQRINHDKWPAGCYRAADPADLEDALDGADAPMVKFNDPASGASTAATGNDYELICEIKVAPASSPSP